MYLKKKSNNVLTSFFGPCVSHILFLFCVVIDCTLPLAATAAVWGANDERVICVARIVRWVFFSSSVRRPLARSHEQERGDSIQRQAKLLRRASFLVPVRRCCVRYARLSAPRSVGAVAGAFFFFVAPALCRARRPTPRRTNARNCKRVERGCACCRVVRAAACGNARAGRTCCATERSHAAFRWPVAKSPSRRSID